MQIPIIRQQKYIAFTSQNSYFPLFFFFFFNWWFRSGFPLNQVCCISKHCRYIFFRVTEIFTLTKTKVCECSCSSLYNVKANCQWLLLLAQILTLQTVRSTFLNMAIFQYSVGSKHFGFRFVNRTTKARELIDSTTGRKIDTVYEILFFFVSHHISNEIPMTWWLCFYAWLSVPVWSTLCKVAALSSAVGQK